MCGILGFSNFRSINCKVVLENMANCLEHRGPNDKNYWFNSKIALAHRRLSIIDPSYGIQPMLSEDNRFVVIFNGEIYNFYELKKQLKEKGYNFRTNSDTEVLLCMYQEYREKMLLSLNGMFAFAIWDNKKHELFLARDRVGEKPLYYTKIFDTLIFASELKALLKYPGFKKIIDPLSIYKYLANEYVPTPNCIFKNVFKFPAASYGIYKNKQLKIYNYWDWHFKNSYFNKMSENDIIFKLDQILTNSIKNRLISDVPLGIFLSGGIDSSAILYYMTKLISSKNINTFSIGFEDKSFDESKYAKEISQYFKTNHHEKILSSKDLINILPKVINCLDEPFADASIIPTYLLSQFTKKYVGVALGGDGGDELFMGYPTFQANRLAILYNYLPNSLHKYLIKPLIKLIPTSINNLSLDFKIKQFLSYVKEDYRYREQLWLGSFNYNQLKKLIRNPNIHKLNIQNIFSEFINFYENNDTKHYLDNLSYCYFKTYLHDDILFKIDRAGMANSLEIRAPFLDLQIINFIATIPHKYKLKKFKSKYILKKLLLNKIPNHLLKRSKKGFGIPIAKWFKKDLKSFILDIFSEEKINKEAYFNYSYINTLLKNHFSGKEDNRKTLWTLLIFELWLEKWGN